MYSFTHALQSHVRSNQPVAHLVTKHLVENLVFVPLMIGMIFFLIEFYRGDKFLAFMVLSLVWVFEVFSVVSLRSSQGIHFFPRIFFLLFSLFHFYLFSFPFGFTYTALASTVCFMAHSMLFFWHRYELPAVAHGLVTLEHPRMGMNMNNVSTPQSIPSLQPEGRISSALPVIHLPFRPTREPDSVNMSRPSSSVFIEDDDSYMYFMDGEVVWHGLRRQTSQTRLQSQQPAGSQGSLHSHETLSSQDRGTSHDAAAASNEAEDAASSNHGDDLTNEPLLSGNDARQTNSEMTPKNNDDPVRRGNSNY
jgi:hypothetical protein